MPTETSSELRARAARWLLLAVTQRPDIRAAIQAYCDELNEEAAAMDLGRVGRTSSNPSEEEFLELYAA